MWSKRSSIAARYVLVILVVVFGVVGALRSVGSALRVDRPDLAFVVAPSDARIAGTQALALMEIGADQARAAEIAKKALRRDIGNIPAVIALGILADRRGDARRARALFSYAQSWTRHDLVSQLWLIQDAVNNANIKGALLHYDYALRASPLAQKILFPILSSSLAESQVRSQVVDLLARKPQWGASFIEASARLGPNYAAVGEAFIELAHRNVAIPKVAQQALLAQINATSGLDAAWELDRKLRGGSMPLVRNTDFVPDRATSGLFDWQIVSDQEVSVGLSGRGGSGGGALSFDISSGGGGRLASQLLVLPSGRYRLRSDGLLFEGMPSALSWRLVCVAGDVPLGTFQFKSAAPRSITANGIVFVPSDCTQQRLDLFFAPPNDENLTSGQVFKVILSPADPNREVKNQ